MNNLIPLFWVQEDASDSDLVGKLEEQGIDKADIVLAFQVPYNRPFTGYAVAYVIERTNINFTPFILDIIQS